MQRRRSVRTLCGLVVAALAGSVLGVVGSATPAAAQSDEQIIIENVPDALDELVDGIQDIVATALDTQSAVATSEAAGDAFVAVGSALVEGTEQFGALGGAFGGFNLVNSSVQNALEPYLTAIDDPSTAGALVNPDDVSTLLANLGPAVAESKPYLQSALIEALRGNLVEDAVNGLVPGMGTPAMLGDLLHAIGVGIPFVLRTNGFVPALLDDTNYSSFSSIVQNANTLVGGLVGSQLHPIEDAVGPGLAEATPVTEPLIGVIAAL